MSATLLPCPFCGGEAHQLAGHIVSCRSPECSILGRPYPTATEGEEAWNRRAQPEPMDMPLCSRHNVVLRVGQLYRFRPVGDCESCAEMVEAAREAYGDSLGAPVTSPALPQT